MTSMKALLLGLGAVVVASGAGAYILFTPISVELGPPDSILPIKIALDDRTAKPNINVSSPDLDMRPVVSITAEREPSISNLSIGATSPADAATATISRSAAAKAALTSISSSKNSRVSDSGISTGTTLQNQSYIAKSAVYFEIDKWVSPKSWANLDAIPLLGIFVVHGHTDRAGTARYNDDLSKKRALSVKQYLREKKQIPASSIRTSWFGESKPRIETNDGVPNGKNRRVEVYVYHD